MTRIRKETNRYWSKEDKVKIINEVLLNGKSTEPIQIWLQKSYIFIFNFFYIFILTLTIRKEVYKLEQFSQQVRFMYDKNIVTKEDLDNFAKNNSNELSELKGMRENLWKRYHKAKTDEKKTQILAEINDIQPKIKELYKYDKYCKEVTKRAEGIKNNLNNFDKDIQKEKDNSRSMWLRLSFWFLSCLNENHYFMLKSFFINNISIFIIDNRFYIW